MISKLLDYTAGACTAASPVVRRLESTSIAFTKRMPLCPHALLALVPLFGYLWLLFYAYLAYLQAGYWPPVYNQPDPTNVGPWVTGEILMGVLLGFMFATPVAFALLSWIASRRALFAPTARAKVNAWSALLGQIAVFGLSSILFTSELMRHHIWLVD